MAKRIVISSLLICLILGTTMAQGRETARSHITQGQEHMRTENFAEAVAAFEAAIRLEPRNRQAPTLLREAQEKRMQQTFNQAQALHSEGNFTEAIVQYNLAVRYAPPGHSNIRMIQNRRDEAQRTQQEQVEQAQEQSARERADLARQAFQKANEHFIGGKYAEAIAEYQNGITIGGLGDNEVTEARRLMAEAEEIQTQMEAFNRPLRDEDFDVLQNRDTSVTIVKFKAFEKKTIRIGGTDHVIQYGISNVTIPTTLYGVRVTIIGPGAFRDAGITSLVIPEHVTEIGASAFSGNRLQRVILNRNLRFIRGGSPVGRSEVVEPGAFEGNPNLTEILIPNEVTEIGARAFRDCGLTSLVLGTKVQIIGESAFRNNKLPVVTLPVSVRRIHRFAFNGNQIQALTIPNGVEVVFDDAFTQNPMTTLIIPASLAQMINLGGHNSPRIGGDHRLYGAFAPSFPDTIARVTLPANVNDLNLESFEQGLRNFYEGQRRVAGTYAKNGPVWTRQ